METLQHDNHTAEKGNWQVLHYRAPWFNPMFNSDEIAIGRTSILTSTARMCLMTFCCVLVFLYVCGCARQALGSTSTAGRTGTLCGVQNIISA